MKISKLSVANPFPSLEVNKSLVPKPVVTILPRQRFVDNSTPSNLNTILKRFTGFPSKN